MNLEHMGLFHQPYNHLYLLPVGSGDVSNSYHRPPMSILRQLEQIMNELLGALSDDQLTQLAKLTGSPIGTFPIAVHAENTPFPHILKADFFLWRQREADVLLTTAGEDYYQKNLYLLSQKQLKEHLQQALQIYQFAAMLEDISQNEWKERALQAYTQHPFIQLATMKQPIIHAVEKMNRSILLGVLTPPEDVSYWRHRVEIVLRPYRALPESWRSAHCSHPIKIAIFSEYNWLQLSCETCHYSFMYDPLTDHAHLVDEVDLPQATKRIATIERQMNELAEGTPKVMNSLQKLQSIKEQFAERTFLEEKGPLTKLMRKLETSQFPEHPLQPTLLSLQDVDLSTIDVLKLVQPFLTCSNQELEDHWVQETSEEARAFPSETSHSSSIHFSSKGFHLYEVEVSQIEAYLAKDETITFHLLIHVLKGEATSKIRALQLHHSPIFGLLRPWPKKLIPHAIKSFW